jgi:hypothetical protein
MSRVAYGGDPDPVLALLESIQSDEEERQLHGRLAEDHGLEPHWWIDEEGVLECLTVVLIHELRNFWHHETGENEARVQEHGRWTVYGVCVYA